MRDGRWHVMDWLFSNLMPSPNFPLLSPSHVVPSLLSTSQSLSIHPIYCHPTVLFSSPMFRAIPILSQFLWSHPILSPSHIYLLHHPNPFPTPPLSVSYPSLSVTTPPNLLPFRPIPSLFRPHPVSVLLFLPANRHLEFFNYQ